MTAADRCTARKKGGSVAIRINTPTTRHDGFTLIEILTVVVIIGIMAAIVIPLFASATDDADQVVFVTDVNTFANAAFLYMSQTGMFLEDATSGVVPAGWETYIKAAQWTSPTPIGGVWDTELNSFGIVSGLGVHFNGVANPGDAYMQKIDKILDDGSLATGGFRKIAADRYYFILAN